MNQKVYHTLEYYKILERLADYASCEEAKDRCHKLVPLTDPAEIAHLQETTADALNRLYRGSGISFSGVHNVNASLKRLDIGGTLNTTELLMICSLLEVAKRVKAYDRSDRNDEKTDSLSPLFSQIQPLSPLLDEIRRCVVGEDEIADDASAALSKIRKSIRGMNDRIHAQLTGLMNNTTTRSYLQDAVITMRDGRYCLPVRAESKTSVPGMVHDQSSSGSTLFIEPMAVVNLNNELKELFLKEQEEMNECMPHYYKITNGHGQGAERVMDAEALFIQGCLSDAQIALEGAYAQIEKNGQESMALCCDFLLRRLSLCMDIKQKYSFEQRRMVLMKHHNSMWINIFNSTSAYYYALIGRVEKIPEIFGEHRLFAVNFLAPGRPMMEMIENQVYLAQGAYAKVIGRSEGILAVCSAMHYALVALHVQIQTAAAYERIGKHGEARTILKQALSDASKDHMVMPFVENFIYLSSLFEGKFPEIDQEFLAKILSLGKAYEENCKKMGKEKSYPEQFKCLTEQELKLTELMAAHMSNKEIAARLYLSEGTVKQYINQIYSKLEITGDTRTKRKQLLEQFYTNN